MDVQLDKHHKVRTDELNFKLVKIRQLGSDSKTPGEDTETMLGYYSTLDALLRGYTRHRTLRSEVQDVAELKALLEDIRKTIEKVVDDAPFTKPRGLLCAAESEA